MTWKCKYCGKTKATNDSTPQRPTFGCHVAKDKKCVWVKG